MKFLRIGSITIIIVSIIWITLSYWVQRKGTPYKETNHRPGDGPNALLVFNPDPIYDFDKQICTEFARGLRSRGWNTTVMNVAQADQESLDSFNLWILCANTYNWAPDQAISGFIRSHNLKQKPVLAITLGSGSTARSKKQFEKLLGEAGALILDSRTFWLLRPNNETSKQNNVLAARSMAFDWAKQKADSFLLPAK